MARSATVYIWYPDNGNIGHAAMHIGAHAERFDNQWYVSWWPADPETGAGFTDTVRGGGMTYDFDVGAEDGDPHVVYRLEGLDINRMKIEWDAIRNKREAHYRLLPKNCSTIVARVLRAGGANKLISSFKAIAYGHNVYWTPKDVAQLCDKMKDAGKATKEKSETCPTKRSSKFSVLFGLR